MYATNWNSIESERKKGDVGEERCAEEGGASENGRSGKRERERLSRGKPKSIKYSKKILGTYILREKYTWAAWKF